MIRELRELKVELMVSIWPTVETASENYPEMLERGLLVRHDRGMHFDATNQEAQKFVWSKAKKHYYDRGIKAFWLDEAEPEYSTYDFDIHRYRAGSNMQIGNIFRRSMRAGSMKGCRRKVRQKL